MYKNHHNCIYIMTNPAYTGYVKIGYAEDLKEKVKNVSIGELEDYEPWAVYEGIPKEAINGFYALIDTLCPFVQVKKRGTKELFRMGKEQAYELFESIAGMTNTKQRLHKIDQENENDNETAAGSDERRKRRKRRYSAKPLWYLLDGEYYALTTWTGSIVKHCERIVQKIGPTEFDRRVEGMKISKNGGIPLFSEDKDAFGKGNFRALSNDKNYVYLNLSTKQHKLFHEMLNEKFPEVKFEYVYEDK